MAKGRCGLKPGTLCALTMENLHLQDSGKSLIDLAARVTMFRGQAQL
jgi:hypothetical protein